MISGGSAGLMMMMALPFSAPPTFSTALAVVRVNSSMFLRVPGPADLGRHGRDDLAKPPSGRGTAATIRMVAWPPQVTMLTFIAPLAHVLGRLTGGTQNGPMAAG